MYNLWETSGDAFIYASRSFVGSHPIRNLASIILLSSSTLKVLSVGAVLLIIPTVGTHEKVIKLTRYSLIKGQKEIGSHILNQLK